MQVAPLEDGRLARAREIYLEAFPESERLPVEDVLDRRLLDRQVLVALGDSAPDAPDSPEPDVLGIAVVIPHPDLSADLLEYLAVDPHRRSGGVGGRLLDAVVARAGTRDVLAELEPPSLSADAERRARFYVKHGFEPAPWQGDYAMPGPVAMQLWHRSGIESPSAPTEFMRRFYSRTYGERGASQLDAVVAGAHPDRLR